MLLTKRFTDLENELMVTKGEGWGEGIVREFGIDMYTLLHLKWINNKVLLYSTGNYFQYPVINHNGKDYEKEYTCITESLYCTAEINAIL